MSYCLNQRRTLFKLITVTSHSVTKSLDPGRIEGRDGRHDTPKLKYQNSTVDMKFVVQTSGLSFLLFSRVPFSHT